MITPEARQTLDQTKVLLAIARHSSGDWGEMDDEDREFNNRSLQNGGRFLSVYKDSRGTRFYIITEHDRSRTTILLPQEY